MPTIKQLEDQGRALLEDQKALVEDTTRNWSEKRDEYDKREADIKSVLEQHVALKAVNGDPFADKAENPVVTTRKSIGEQSPRASRPSPRRRTWRPTSASVTPRLTITEAGGGVGTVIPQYQPGIVPTLFRRLTVSDLLPQGTIVLAVDHLRAGDGVHQRCRGRR
jgi:hypothetical protein